MNDAPFGALAPNPFERAIMALTGRMPDTWAGLKLFGQLDEARFRRVVLVLLLLSGVSLVVLGR